MRCSYEKGIPSGSWQACAVTAFDPADLTQVRCFACGGSEIRPIIAVSSEGIAPGKPEHQIAYRHVVICRCAECDDGFVEVRNHDCFDAEEVWDQDEWFTFDSASARVLAAALPACPAPHDATCTCAIHRSLRAARLPARPWASGLEAAAHIRPVRIESRADAPTLIVG